MTLLYQSQYFSTYQCDLQRCFFLDLGSRKIRLTCCQLLALRHKLNSIDLDAHFDPANPHELEILSICNREHILILETKEIIDLKDLIRMTFGFFEINSLLEI